jgi:hypothetical protein
LQIIATVIQDSLKQLVHAHQARLVHDGGPNVRVRAITRRLAEIESRLSKIEEDVKELRAGTRRTTDHGELPQIGIDDVMAGRLGNALSSPLSESASGEEVGHGLVELGAVPTISSASVESPSRR